MMTREGIYLIFNEQIIAESSELNKHVFDKWLKVELFSYQWFVVVFMVLIAYVLFFTLSDKRRLSELLLFGSMFAVFVAVYDSAALFAGLWTYHVSVLPFYANLLMGDITILPLLAMLIYQGAHNWRRFLLWYIGYSVVAIFGGYFLLFSKLGIFAYEHYMVFVDFTSFVICGIVARALMVAIKKKEAAKGNTEAQQVLSNLI